MGINLMRTFLGLGTLFALGLFCLAAQQDSSAGPSPEFSATPPAALQGEDKAKKGEDKKGGKEDEKEAKGPFKNFKYRLIGPAAGGRVSPSCGVPGDPSIYYIAAASGGVLKTTDGRLNRKAIFDGEVESPRGAIALSPSH